MWRRPWRDTIAHTFLDSSYAAGLPPVPQLQESVTNAEADNAEREDNDSADVLGMDEARHELCPICHEEAGTEILVTTGCKHHYHQPCLEQWKKFSRGQFRFFRCPVW